MRPTGRLKLACSPWLEACDSGLGLSVKGLSLPPNAQVITQFLFALHLLMDSWPNKVIE